MRMRILFCLSGLLFAAPHASTQSTVPTQPPDTPPFQPPTMQDCNGNGVQDSLDITFGMSVDLNGDGLPDECCLGECNYPFDCNENEVLDRFDIALGTSNDCNCNNVPDECEDVGPQSCVETLDPDSDAMFLAAGQWQTVAGGTEGKTILGCGGGSNAALRDDFSLRFSNLPPAGIAWVVAGNSSANPRVGLRYGPAGPLVGGPLDLYGPYPVSAAGTLHFTRPIASGTPGFIRAGDEIRFQVLYASAAGELLGFSGGYSVRFVHWHEQEGQ